MRLPRRSALLLVCCFCCTAMVAGLAHAQTEQRGKPREITSDDFARKRPATPKDPPRVERPPVGQKTGKVDADAKAWRRRRYRLAKTVPAPRRRRRPEAQTGRVEQVPKYDVNTASPATTVQAEIGITFWLLRPSLAGEEETRLRVLGDSGIPTWWTPIRVEPEHLFSLNDKVRLTVESPLSGYLYVVDREVYEDGSLGEAVLIFPTEKTRGGNNRVGAGELIDIPSAEDRTPYFHVASKPPRADYAGELLTFIVVPQPFAEFRIGARPLNLPREMVESWENAWGVEVDRYEMMDGLGIPQTRPEQEAARGKSRQLTQDEPMPQTIYRVAVRRGDPLFVNVPLRAK